MNNGAECGGHCGEVWGGRGEVIACRSEWNARGNSAM